MTAPHSHPRWRKSSYSGTNGDCVEVAWAERVQVRDSKHGDGPRLDFAAAQWHALLALVGHVGA